MRNFAKIATVFLAIRDISHFVLYKMREISHSRGMDNINRYTTTQQHKTERLQLLTEISPEDEDRLASLAEGSALPRGTALANAAFLYICKIRKNEREGKPLPAGLTPPLKNS